MCPLMLVQLRSSFEAKTAAFVIADEAFPIGVTLLCSRQVHRVLEVVSSTMCKW